MTEKKPCPHRDQLERYVDLLLKEQEGFLVFVVKQYAWKLQLHEADIDDLVQECRIRLWRTWTRSEIIPGSTIDNVQGYLRRVAYHTCIDHLRECSKKPQTTSLTSPEEDSFFSQI